MARHGTPSSLAFFEVGVSGIRRRKISENPAKIILTAKSTPKACELSVCPKNQPVKATVNSRAVCEAA